MSLLNPFAGLSQLHLVPRYLADLRNDISTLFEKNLPMNFNLPPKESFTDAAAYASAVVCLARLHRFRVVRQAVAKALIRQTIWRRIGILYSLCGFVAVPLWCIGIVIVSAWLLAHPGLANHIGFECVAQRFLTTLDSIFTTVTNR